MPLIPCEPPHENIRKPVVFWCFQGISKEISGIKSLFFFLFFFFGGGDSYESGAIVFVEQLFVDTIIENHSVQPPPSFIFKMKGLDRIFIYRYTLLCTRRGHFCSLGEEFLTKAFDYHKAIPLFMKFEWFTWPHIFSDHHIIEDRRVRMYTNIHACGICLGMYKLCIFTSLFNIQINVQINFKDAGSLHICWYNKSKQNLKNKVMWENRIKHWSILIFFPWWISWRY